MQAKEEGSQKKEGREEKEGERRGVTEGRTYSYYRSKWEHSKYSTYISVHKHKNHKLFLMISVMYYKSE